MTFRINADGTIETTSIDEAIALAKRIKGQPVQAKEPAVRVVKAKPAPAQAANGVSNPRITEDNIEILLKAAGLKVVRARTRDLYGFFLNNPNHDWSAEEVAVRLGRKINTQAARNRGGRNGTVSGAMLRLAKLGALKRTGFDSYRLA